MRRLLALTLIGIATIAAALPGWSHDATTSSPPKIDWARGLEPGKAYPLTGLATEADALSMLVTLPMSNTYLMNIRPSGTVSFQEGRLGHYSLTGLPRPPDVWRPTTASRGIATVDPDSLRGLFAEKAEWSDQSVIDVTRCPPVETGLHYNIAYSSPTTTAPVEILLRDRKAPIRLNCDPRADAFEKEPTSLLAALISTNPSR
jgi:hypothetical protein